MNNNYSIKFHSPKIDKKILERENINLKFDMAYEKGNLFVFGNFGYGKSTSVALWLKSRNISFSWLNLDELDNDLISFCRCFGYSILNAQKENKSLEGILESTDFSNTPLEHLLEIITNVEKENDLLFILDDFHLINKKNIQRYLYLILKRFPTYWKIMIISQLPPPKHLYLKTLKKQLYMIEESDLKFTYEETCLLLKLYGFSLPRSQILKIEQTTEGWVMAILSIINIYMNGADDFNIKIHDCINRFFSETIWCRLSCSIKVFLMRTSVFDELNPLYCNNVLNITNSNSIFTMLKQLNTFITLLNDGNYKYHPLFKAFLLEQLESSKIVNAQKEYLNYANWIEHFNIDKALDFYLKGKSYEKVLELTIERPFWGEESLFNKSGLFTLIAEQYSPFMIKTALSCYYMGKINEMNLWLTKFDNWVIQSNYDLHKNSSVLYLYLLCKIIRPNHSPRKLIDSFEQGKKTTLSFNQYPLTVLTQNMTSFLRGSVDFSFVMNNTEKYLKELKTSSAYILGSYSVIFEELLLAEIHYEKNELSSALEIIEKVVSSCQDKYQIDIYFIAMCRLALIQYALNLKNKSFETLNKIREVIINEDSNHFIANFNALYTRLKLMMNENKYAHLWLEENYNPDCSLKFFNIEQHFTTVNGLISVKRYNEALIFIENLHNLCKNYDRIIDLIEVYILKAVCLEKNKEKNEFLLLKTIYDAVMLSQKYKFTQVFVSKKKIYALLELLLEKSSYYKLSGINVVYVKSLIVLSKKYHSFSDSIASEVCYVKLSNKQREMLGYLALDMSYDDICRLTGLKITTIRTHISKLYQKFDVNSKKEVLLKAGELGFFDL